MKTIFHEKQLSSALKSQFQPNPIGIPHSNKALTICLTAVISITLVVHAVVTAGLPVGRLESSCMSSRSPGPAKVGTLASEVRWGRGMQNRNFVGKWIELDSYSSVLSPVAPLVAAASKWQPLHPAALPRLSEISLRERDFFLLPPGKALCFTMLLFCWSKLECLHVGFCSPT